MTMENEQAQSRSVTPFKTSAELAAEARVLFEEVAPAVHAACSAIYEDGDRAGLDEERVAGAAEAVGRLSATLAPYVQQALEARGLRLNNREIACVADLVGEALVRWDVYRRDEAARLG
jgi:hypothetical protein